MFVYWLLFGLFCLCYFGLFRWSLWVLWWYAHWLRLRWLVVWICLLLCLVHYFDLFWVLVFGWLLCLGFVVDFVYLCWYPTTLIAYLCSDFCLCGCFCCLLICLIVYVWRWFYDLIVQQELYLIMYATISLCAFIWDVCLFVNCLWVVGIFVYLIAWCAFDLLACLWFVDLVACWFVLVVNLFKIGSLLVVWIFNCCLRVLFYCLMISRWYLLVCKLWACCCILVIVVWCWVFGCFDLWVLLRCVYADCVWL